MFSMVLVTMVVLVDRTSLSRDCVDPGPHLVT